MRTFKIITFFVVFALIKQAEAQTLNPDNADISLVDVRWVIKDYKKSDYCMLSGVFKIINNINKKIVIKEMSISKHNTYTISPTIGLYKEIDSLVILPFGQKEFLYHSSTFLLQGFGNISVFFKNFDLDMGKYNRPKIGWFYIKYYIEDNPKELKTYGGGLFLWLDNLTDFSEELTDSIMPFVNRQKCDEYNRKKKNGSQVMKRRELGGTLFEQRICPCIENKE